MNPSQQPRTFPLILPNGDEVDLETFKSCGYKISEYMKRYEVPLKDPLNVCLNKMTEIETNFIYESFSNEIRNENMRLNPEKAVRLILFELIEKIRGNYQHPILADNMIELKQSKIVCDVLKKAVVLRSVQLSELKTIEDTSCFLINLTNLMFLHTLIFNTIELGKEFVFMNWVSRQIHFNSVGYFVGQLGFVSLHDLYSFLFKFPTIPFSSDLSSLKYSTDPRIPFAIGQPYCFSPKIHVAYPDTLDEYLKSSQTEYLNMCSVLSSELKTIVPIPLLLQVERSFFIDQLVPFTFKNADLIRDKVNSLITLIGNDSLMCADVMKDGILLVNEPQFTVQFSYSDFLMTLHLKSLRLFTWKFCCHHVSFFHCCTDFMLIVKTAILEDRYKEFPTENIKEIEKKISIDDVYEKIAIFAAQFAEKFIFDSNDCPEYMRCLYNVLFFITGESNNLDTSESTLFENIFRAIQKVAELKTPVSEIFAKIRVCGKVLMLDEIVFSKWMNWYNLFVEEPSKVLSLIIEQKNINLAMEFVDAQSLYNPFYDFNLEVYGTFLSLLCVDGDSALLKNYIHQVTEFQLIEMTDLLIEKECKVDYLKTFVDCILCQLKLSDVGHLKFYTLWMGLRMLTAVPEDEQVLFYEILHFPKLIIEQIIMNKCTSVLKRVLNVSKKPLVEHKVVTELEAEFQNDVDALLLCYAEKILYFSKNPFSEPTKKIKNVTFIPPKKVPSVEQWVPDERAPNCMLCQRLFTVFTRRHHCRRCGRVSCHFCSTRKLKLDDFDTKVKICDDCYEYEKPLEILNGYLNNSVIQSESKIFWRLSADERSNNSLRQKVTFDDGPDITCCMALVELHTPNDTLARFLCGKAEEMTKILRHRLVFSANFDYNQVTLCARSLTYAAKLIFSHLNDSHGVRRCEEMASEIELLKICANIDYVPVDPNKPMRDVEQWNVIKDRLTNLGEWKKALEIASKIGADTKSIWFLWGLSLIKSGDWISAREKFKFSSMKKNSSIIKEILETIESSVNGPKYEESLYYIRLYGNDMQLYRYYVQHCKIEEAVEMTFRKNIPPELFAETLFDPLVPSAKYKDALKQMKTLDPTLARWKEHIKYLCDFFRAEQKFGALYEMENWMNDYYNAALSCIKFFKEGSTCYKDLLNKSEWLSQAICHLKSFSSKSEEISEVKCAEKVHVDKLLKLLHWQIQINATICANEPIAIRIFKKVPTLFGEAQETTEIIDLIFTVMNDVGKAFLYTHKIVDECSLDFDACYCAVASTLMSEKREKDVDWLVDIIEKKSPNPKSSIDAIMVAIVRARPNRAARYYNRISDFSKKFDVLIETEQFKNAFIVLNRYKNPTEQLEKLEQIARLKNLAWLKILLKSRSPNAGTDNISGEGISTSSSELKPKSQKP